jgi:hypothetical protein
MTPEKPRAKFAETDLATRGEKLGAASNFLRTGFPTSPAQRPGVSDEILGADPTGERECDDLVASVWPQSARLFRAQ